jgi:putative ABC transport system permease protein
MNFVALKMLIGDKLKYIALIAGVSFAALLIMQQASIFTGYMLQIGAWIRDTGSVDLWISDPQMEHVEDFKPLTDTALDRVRSVSGVAWAVPVYKGILKSRLPDGTLVNARVIGLDDATLAGGPPQMVQGQMSDLRGDNAVIVNEADLNNQLALRRSSNPDEHRALRVGDHVSVNDHDARVVGVFRATHEFFWQPVFYATYSQARTWAPAERKLLTYVLAKVNAGQDVHAVAQRIGEQTGLLARTGHEFDWDTTSWVLKKTGILVNFGITIGLGVVIGLLVAGQTFYTFVLDNLRPFAALKAMGASNAMMLRMLFVQVLVVAGVGYGLGLGAASVSGAILSRGGLAFQMAWPIPIAGALAVLICCMLAGSLGMVRVLRLEPAVVFKS